MHIIFKTYQGDFFLQVQNRNQSLISLFIQNQIPFNSITLFAKPVGRDTLVKISNFNKSLSELAIYYQEIYIQPDRNINYEALINKPIVTENIQNPVSEYLFNDDDKYIHRLMNVDDCRKYTEICVENFLSTIKINSTTTIVVGISGGGDSNTLIGSLLKNGRIKSNQIKAVMMLGIPDWDKGLERAKKICSKYNIELETVGEAKVAELLKYNGKESWVDAYERIFKDDDLEIIGTLAIRLALEFVAKKNNSDTIILGANLEDILAESFYRLRQGKLPLPFPIRKIGDFYFWYPLYKVPKKILDGCFPLLSEENYTNRYPSFMLGRVIPYYLSQMTSNILPGSEFDLVQGFQKLSQLNQEEVFLYDDDLEMYLISEIDLESRYKWKEFLGRE